MKETKQSKEQKRIELETIILVLVFIGFICLIVWVGGKPSRISQDFCKSLGFEKATDEYTMGVYVGGVECDKEYIYFVCKEKECISKDKWGNCDYKYYLEAQNNTIMGECD